MDGALSYLLLVRFKNQMKALVKSPGKLAYLVGIVAILWLTASSGRGNQEAQLRDIRELTAGIFVLYAFIFVLIAKNGFNKGASMFHMNDVNLLFTAPVSPQKVLFYGLFQQLGTSLLFGVFLLFQYAWLNNIYGVSYEAVIALLVGYGITVFCAQLSAMAIYAFTHENERRQRRVKIVFYGVFVAYAVALVVFLMRTPDQILPQLLTAMDSLAFHVFPVVGWTASITGGVIVSGYFWTIMGVLLTGGFIAGLAVLIVRGKPDYYEDVLSSTERTEETLTAKRQGRMSEVGERKIRAGKTGIGRGTGASVFYYKHLLENRRSRVFLINAQMLLFALVTIGVSYFMRDSGLFAVFIFSTYMLLFGVAFGRLQKELIKPYVYLVPEPPFKKLIACIREGFRSYLLEAAIVFIPVGLLLDLAPQVILLCIAARFSFAILFVAANIVVGRVFGSLTSKMFSLLAYFVAVVVLSIPGIFVALFLMDTNTDVAILLTLTCVNIPVALAALFLCRNMLEYTELNN